MVSNQKNLNVLEDFSMKDTKCKTHKKASKIKNETTKFVPSITPSRKNTVFDQFKFHTRKFTVRTVDFIQNIEQHLILVEAEIEDLRFLSCYLEIISWKRFKLFKLKRVQLRLILEAERAFRSTIIMMIRRCGKR